MGSILAQSLNEGTLSTKSASWMVEGIGEDFLPGISDFSRVKKAYAISDKESFLTARELLKKEGILGGSSTGTLLAAALRYCREQREAKRVVTLVCDTGNKYLSKLYNDYWMLDNGFLERPHATVALGDALHHEQAHAKAREPLGAPAPRYLFASDCPMISCAVKLMPQVGNALPTKKLSGWAA